MELHTLIGHGLNTARHLPCYPRETRENSGQAGRYNLRQSRTSRMLVHMEMSIHTAKHDNALTRHVSASTWLEPTNCRLRDTGLDHSATKLGNVVVVVLFCCTVHYVTIHMPLLYYIIHTMYIQYLLYYVGLFYTFVMYRCMLYCMCIYVLYNVGQKGVL
jgi:hypothetical protein